MTYYLTPGWRLCGTKDEPRLLNHITGQILETYPEELDRLRATLAGQAPTSNWLRKTISQGVLGPRGTSVLPACFGPDGSNLDDVQLDITSRCDQHCPMCYQSSELYGKELPIQHALSIISQARALGAARIAVSGGEPLLYPNLQEIIDASIKHELLFCALFTNAPLDTLRLPHYTHILRSHNPSLGLCLSAEIIHDTLREHNLTVNTLTLDGSELPQLYDWLAEFRVTRWRVGVPRPVGRGKQCPANLSKVITAYRILLDRYLRDYEAGCAPFEFQLGFAFQSRFLQAKRIDLYPSGAPCCYYKRHSLVVKWDGLVRRCSMDNVIQGHWSDLKAAWHMARWALRRPANQLEGCKGCRLLPLCNGGCRACAQRDSRDPIACATYAFLDSILPRLRALGVVCDLVRS